MYFFIYCRPVIVLFFISGGIIGGIVKVSKLDLHQEEAFPPTIFFLVILPPIIFESGYNLHKVNKISNFNKRVKYGKHPWNNIKCSYKKFLYYSPLGLPCPFLGVWAAYKAVCSFSVSIKFHLYQCWFSIHVSQKSFSICYQAINMGKGSVLDNPTLP